MMKKLLPMALLTVSLLAFAACGSDNNTQEDIISQENSIEASTSEQPQIEARTPEQAQAEIPTYITIQGQHFSTSITELDFGWSRSGISYLTNEDIIPLKYMTNLTTLDLVNNQITDLSPLANLTSLTSLRLNFNQITDISPLVNLTNLQKLNVGSNQITDISSVAGLVNLTDFRAHDNRITDITALSELTKLTGLNLSSNLITDITAISELTNLTELSLERNQIADITPLAGLTNLYHILLDNNPFTDWSPLNNLFPPVASPTVTPVPDNPHLFADVLSNFFVNLVTPPNLHRGRPTSYHAVLVNINGTPGMLASKWTSDNVNYSHWFPNEIGPVFVQRLFYIYDNQLHEISDYNWWAVTQTGQLVRLNGVDNILSYILLSVIDGNLVSTKSISSISYQGMWGYLSGDENREDEYFVNHHNDILPWFGEDWMDYNLPITLEEFNEMKSKYGLHDLITHLWDIPDETLTILLMSAE